MGIYLTVDISSERVVALAAEVADSSAVILSKVQSAMSYTDLLEQSAAGQSSEGVQVSASTEVADIRSFVDKYENLSVRQILLTSPDNLITLNLTTPFADQNLLNDIIAQEIQDRVPFEIDEFTTVHKVARKISEGEYELQVALMLKSDYQRIAEFCRLISFEPNLITVPAAVLNVLGASTRDGVYLSRAGDSVNAACQISGTVCAAGQVENAEQFRELQMLLLDWENRYQTNFQEVYLIGNSIDVAGLEKGLSLKVEQIKIPEAEGVEHAYLSAIAAARKDNPFLINFKTQRNALSQLLEFSTVFLRRTWLSWLFIIALIIALPLAMIAFNYYEAQQVNSAVQDEIKNNIPDLSVVSASGMDELLGRNGEMEAQLATLGTPTKFDPLSVYVILSSELKQALDPKIGMTLSEIEIKGADVTVDGLVSSYRSVESIEKIFNKRGDVFCEVKKETLGDSGANKRFRFRIKLC